MSTSMQNMCFDSLIKRFHCPSLSGCGFQAAYRSSLQHQTQPVIQEIRQRNSCLPCSILWWSSDPAAVCAGCWNRLTGTPVTENPIRHWPGRTVTSLLGSALHRYAASKASPGSDKWTQFPFVYLSVVWTTEHMLVCPPINLYPVNTTPLNQHISPPKQHRLTKHAVTQSVKDINTLPVKLLGNAHQADNYKIAADK